MTIEPLHPQETRRSNYQYCFTSKHHGGGGPDDARWSISLDQEFLIFDVADQLEVHDDDQNYFGILPVDGILADIGTWTQQLAECPRASVGSPWHGYPLWAINHSAAPSNRTSARSRPSKAVFEKLEVVGLISKQQRKRLYKGEHA